MPLTNRLAAMAAVLLAASIVIAAVILTTNLPPLAWLMPLLLIVAAAVLVARQRREPAVADTRLRLDLDRLRPGRLRNYVLRALGYHRQFQALAETLPHASLREALHESLPVIDATVRTIYMLCIGLQAYELGESQPPGLAGLKRAEARQVIKRTDAALQHALDTLRQLYADLRGSWSEPSPDPIIVAKPIAALDGRLHQLRDLAAMFSQPRYYAE